MTGVLDSKGRIVGHDAANKYNKWLEREAALDRRKKGIKHEPLHRAGNDVSRQMRRALARHDYKRRRARERRALGWVARYVGDFRHGRPWQEALEASE